jgi:glucose-6-phosphate 1-dehydrogenase
MSDVGHENSSIFSIFGGAGDLAWRKLIPALYDMFLDRWMPKRYALLCLGHLHTTKSKYLEHIRSGVDQYSRKGKTRNDDWKEFASHMDFLEMELDQDQSYKDLKDKLTGLEKEWSEEANMIFYLATPPSMIEPITKGLAKTKLNQRRERTRIVVEKPFGNDLDSARELNRLLAKTFDENQIFRIDHFLGKETVQNILAFRLANALFEPVWNRHYIDHVQINVAEQIGVGNRGHYYEKSGALRDMIQNHLLQILCLVAMEAPISMDDNEVRNKKVDVLRAIRPIPYEQVHNFAVRGQYGSGWLEGEHVKSYHKEENVDKHSHTETFAAVKFYIDNWRWQGVPFYLRTGKRLISRVTEVSIQFKPVPHQTFPSRALLDQRPNRLVISIQPEEGILLRFESKQPGPNLSLSPVMMQFFYREAFQEEHHEAYETLLLDVMRGDATLFMRADQTEAAWEVIMPILEVWSQHAPTDFPNYQSGSWGPELAEILIAQDGRSWALPTILQCREDIAMCRVQSAPEDDDTGES